MDLAEYQKCEFCYTIGFVDALKEREELYPTSNEHLEILIKLSKSILDDEFREKLEVTNSEIEVLELLNKYTA